MNVCVKRCHWKHCGQEFASRKERKEHERIARHWEAFPTGDRLLDIALATGAPWYTAKRVVSMIRRNGNSWPNNEDA